MNFRSPLPLLPLLCVALPALNGCRASVVYAESADAEVYGYLEEITGKVTGLNKTFPIGERDDTLRARILRGEVQGTIRMNLQQALDVAAENNRGFKTSKETLYRSALALSSVMDSFEIQYQGGTGAGISGVGDENQSWSINSDLSQSANTTSGQTVVASFANTFLRNLFSGGNVDSDSILNLGINSPIVRGFGRRIAREPLTQAERNVVYAVRNFERSRRELAVSVFSAFLDLLNAQLNLAAVEANVASLQLNLRRTQALFDEGQVGIIDIGRAQQSELTARNNRVNAIQGLENQLDNFKFTLGLPIDCSIELEAGLVEQLQQVGVTDPGITDTRAVELALMRRFDLRTALDRVDDSRRDVLISEDALQSFVNFSGNISVPSDPDQPFAMDFTDIAWSAGLDVDFDLERTAERNNYRDSLIALDQAHRAVEQLSDAITRDIRFSLRTIRRLIENYRISEIAVDLAEQRVDSAKDLFEVGQADQNDVLDAETALLNARLDLNDQLRFYVVARLGLINDLEGLAIEPQGLRIDLSLQIPDGPMNTPDARGAARDASDT